MAAAGRDAASTRGAGPRRGGAHDHGLPCLRSGAPPLPDRSERAARAGAQRAAEASDRSFEATRSEGERLSLRLALVATAAVFFCVILLLPGFLRGSAEPGIDSVRIGGLTIEERAERHEARERRQEREQAQRRERRAERRERRAERRERQGQARERADTPVPAPSVVPAPTPAPEPPVTTPAPPAPPPVPAPPGDDEDDGDDDEDGDT